ncbi:MAG: polyamine ABC transporter ATP-binding protein [Ancylobacter novellus]|uniref:Spermidine/putrescine import ATP-binding protein PotA n=1 Tax=Ancylobacter novellus TaxID=921 RepID=A0A2W5KB95_ANCNO|nr:MAG: polyamine ABC transporter ATP-binding protein [Ancylobacter novellus]
MAPKSGAHKALGPIRRSFAPWLDPTAVPLIRFENVVKKFGDFTAVDDVSLDIHQREFFSLLGPSGCGKTTLMRMLAGFEQPTAGRITLAGEDLAGTPPYKRPVNMMFQSYALFPHMTVAQNIAFGPKQDGMPKAEIAARVEEMLALVKLTPFASRKPHQLSGGQRQRVALARSLAKRPKVLLLDEPLGALDKKLREETQFELMDLQMELGLTFLIVTHDQEEAMTVSDRIGVMNHGKLVQVATPGDIYEQPNSSYVAEFIGNINMIDGTVESAGGGEIRVKGDDPAGEFLLASEGAASVGQKVKLAVRPEKMRISIEPPPEDARNVLKGEVWDLAYMGDWTVVLVKIDGSEKVMRVSRANMTRTEAKPIAWDDRVHVWFAPDAGVALAS